jgi:hypothetical protein
MGAAWWLRPRRLAAIANRTHSLKAKHFDPADETSASCPAFGHRQDGRMQIVPLNGRRQVQKRFDQSTGLRNPPTRLSGDERYIFARPNVHDCVGRLASAGIWDISSKSHQRSWWIIHTWPTKELTPAGPRIPPTQLVDCSYPAYKGTGARRSQNPTNAVGGWSLDISST